MYMYLIGSGTNTKYYGYSKSKLVAHYDNFIFEIQTLIEFHISLIFWGLEFIVCIAHKECPELDTKLYLMIKFQL